MLMRSKGKVDPVRCVIFVFTSICVYIRTNVIVQ